MGSMRASDALKSLLHWLAEYAPALDGDEFALVLEIARRLHGHIRANNARRGGSHSDIDPDAFQAALKP